MDKNNENENISSAKGPLQFLRGGLDSQNSARPPAPPADRNGAVNRRTEPSSGVIQNNTFPGPNQNAKQQVGNNTDKIFVGNPRLKSNGLLRKIKNRLLPEQTDNPTRQKIMLILIPILAIMMIFLFRQVLSKAPQQSRAATEDEMPLKALNKTSCDEIHWDIPEAIPVTIRDPIKPVSKATPEDAAQSRTDSNNTDIVRGILYSDDKPSAVIGDRLVHLNDEIEGAKIVWIGKDSVTFEKDGEKWTKKVVELELRNDKDQTEQQEEYK